VGIETIQRTASREKCKKQQNNLKIINMRSWKKTVILLNKLLLVQLLTVAFQLRVHSGQSENPIYLPEFSLQGTDGRFYSNKDFEENDLLAVIFLSNHCKISQLFQNQLIKIAELMREKKVAIVAVSPNYDKAVLPDEQAYSDLGDSFMEMKKRALRKNYTFPYLFDGEKQTLTRKMGVKITPSVFLYNKNREMVYAGRIGNHDLSESLEASDLYKSIISYLDGGGNKFKRTKVFGTAIKFSDDLLLAEQVRKRYSDETVRITAADERKLKFYLNHKTGKPKLFYVWKETDTDLRDNLITISTLYKIFRKRGLKLITVCISERQNTDSAIEALEQAQLSSTNFIVSGNQVSPLTTIIPSDISSITPFYRLIGGDGKMLQGEKGKIEKDDLRLQILSALNNN